MVSNKFLGALCVRLGFHRHLKQSHAALVGQIQEYVAEIQEVEAESKGARDYWTVTKNPPKVCATLDAFNSLTGSSACLISSNLTSGPFLSIRSSVTKKWKGSSSNISGGTLKI